MSNTRDRILSILRATGHPGIETVIEYHESSIYFKCGDRHRYYASK